MDYEDEFLTGVIEYNLQLMLEKAENTVLAFTASTSATGAIPIPFSDWPLLVGQQVAMVMAINTVFEIDMEKDAVTSLVSAVIGIGGATAIGKTAVATILKLIPGIGSVAGGACPAATAGLLTFGLGKAYIQVCQNVKMGKLDVSDITGRKGLEQLKAAFKEQLRRNKASNLQR